MTILYSFFMDYIKGALYKFGKQTDGSFFICRMSHYQKFGTYYKSIRNRDGFLLKI